MEAVATRAGRVNLDSGLHEASDSELVKKAKRGDADAFSVLVRRHQHRVYGLAYRYMRNPDRADDMAQEAFLKGFRLLKGFRGDCSFSTWMYRVTSSVCLTEIARRKRRGEVQLEEYHQDGLHAKDRTANDTDELIRKCVTRLPERYATIVTMYYLEEMPYEEIAAAMEIPLGTLKTWMFRARKELRGLVEEELGKDGLREERQN